MCVSNEKDMKNMIAFAEGYGKGLTTMKRMVLKVIREHKYMTTQEVEQYIKENL